MTLCIVTHCYPLSQGDIFGNFLPDFCASLRGEGHRVLILTPHMQGFVPLSAPPDLRTFTWMGGRKRMAGWKPYNPLDLLALTSLMRRGTAALIDLIRSEGIEFCIACWALPSGIFCRRARSRTGVPYAVWALGSDINVYARKPVLKDIVRQVLKDADLLFANSDGLIRAVDALCGRRPDFMPTNRILPRPGTRHLELGRGRRPLLFVGRLEPVKGIDLLMQAVAVLVARGLPVDLWVLGDGSMREEMERMAGRAPLQGRVFLKGNVDAETVADHLEACDLLVIPSRSEGMPVVFHEAMQCRRPVVATEVGDLGGIIREYGVGVVARSPDADGIAGAIVAALEQGIDSLSRRTSEVGKRFDIRASARTFSEAIKRGEK